MTNISLPDDRIKYLEKLTESVMEIAKKHREIIDDEVCIHPDWIDIELLCMTVIEDVLGYGRSDA